MKLHPAIPVVCAVLCTAAVAGDSTAAAGGAVAIQQRTWERILVELGALRADLTGAYGEYTGSDPKVVESYLGARARIDAAVRWVKDNFRQGEAESMSLRAREARAQALLEPCSLLTVLAITQMNKGRVETEAAALAVRRDSLAAALAAVYREIIEAERGRAAEFKRKLDGEREKAQKLRREMEQRFKELESALIKVRRDARGTIVSMSDLLFGFDKADVTGELRTSLAKIAGILLVYKQCKVIVEGHTDTIGTAEYNKQLSERRAVNVKTFLVQQGVAADRLSAVGYGWTRPIASNSTREGRQRNRRVDLVVLD